MEFEGEFSVAASPEETWAFLLDPEELSSCIPNCQDVEVIDESHYTATIGIEISYISATFDTNVEILEQDEEEYLKVHITGNAEEGDSRMEATGEMWMTPRDDGGTDVEYRNTVDVTGRVMNMGSRIVKSVGQRQTNKTVENIQAGLGDA
ncbi:CoxG family protein [Salinigranum salinum]|uniref:CoxG family protein n=1 Tax=Salinigranum salinum TaxID=1364937 RepID=UPI0012612F14|nr:carbon monoxide dehydrogenase subunit G [Salinigranum salinum]